jgi:hypothetical protein
LSAKEFPFRVNIRNDRLKIWSQNGSRKLA